MAAKPTTDSAMPAPATSQFELVVIHPFDSYQRGDRISDPAEVARVSDSEQAHHCNRVVKQ